VVCKSTVLSRVLSVSPLLALYSIIHHTRIISLATHQHDHEATHHEQLYTGSVEHAKQVRVLCGGAENIGMDKLPATEVMRIMRR
jgi:hypothetical protein